jgi:hypothetical protein
LFSFLSVFLFLVFCLYFPKISSLFRYQYFQVPVLLFFDLLFTVLYVFLESIFPCSIRIFDISPFLRVSFHPQLWMLSLRDILVVGRYSGSKHNTKNTILGAAENKNFLCG